MSAPQLTPSDRIAAPPLSAAETTPSALETFLSGFFQEKNIRWMLIIGAAIVFGSSLMLVTRVWSSFDHTLKYLTVFSYTAGIFGIAEFCRRRLNLELTWKVLHSLTLLLLPICFHWLSLTRPDTGGLLNLVKVIGLLIPTGVFLWFASSRILDNLLGGRQTTYLINYQLLCLAGVVPTFAPGNALPAFGFMCICWLILTAGVLKVSRHVFWLQEEQRTPAVFGFLPVSLLGLQFLMLMVTKTLAFGGTPQCIIPLQWLGLGLTLVGATVLLTARSVAAVWRQRAVDEENTMPWTVVVPLLAGIMTTAFGVVLSFSGFHFVGPTTTAVVPTAAVAACLMFVMAHDLRHPRLVWIALLFTTIAYQCSPVLFGDLIRMVKQGVESAIHEPRLPIAFYGLTYLPLIAVIAGVSGVLMKRSEEQFSRPLKHYATILILSLFAVALTHTKAMFLVSSVNIATFIILAILLKDRRYILPGIAALVLATGSVIPALNGMQLTAIDTAWSATALAALAVLLTAFRLPDRLINLIPANWSLLRHVSPESGRVTRTSLVLKHADESDRELLQLAGCLLAGCMGLHWATMGILNHETPAALPEVLQFGLLLASLTLYALRQPHYLTGTTIWLLAGFAGIRWASGAHIETRQIIQFATVTLASCWGLAWLFLAPFGITANISSAVRRTLGVAPQTGLVPVAPDRVKSIHARVAGLVLPLADVSFAAMGILLIVLHLPAILAGNLHLLRQLTVGLSPATAVCVIWLTAAAWLHRNRVLMVTAIILFPLWATAMLITSGIVSEWQTVLCVWGLLIVPIHLCASRFNNRLILTQSGNGLGILALLSCVTFDPQMRVCGLIALIGLSIGDVLNSGKCSEATRRSQRTWCAIFGTLHLSLLTANLKGAAGFILSPQDPAIIPVVLLTLAGTQILLNRLQSFLQPDSVRAWCRFLTILMGLMSAAGIMSPTQYSPLSLMGMTLGLFAAATVQIRTAIRSQKTSAVWFAFGLICTAALFLLDQGVVHYDDSWCQVICMGISVMLLSITHLTRNRTQLRVLHQPFTQVAQILPMYTVLRFPFAGQQGSQLWSATCLLVAAAVYAQRTITTRLTRFGILTAVTGNLGLIMLWKLLNVADPGFYLVPAGLTVLAFTGLLKKQIPHAAHEPLRYTGALLILMSPVTQLLSESWVPVLTLLVSSVALILLAIGLKLRALVYAGTAALAAALLTMVMKSRVEYPFLPWLCGIGLGIAVIGIAALCENHREKVLSRIRVVTAELATWN